MNIGAVSMSAWPLQQAYDRPEPASVSGQAADAFKLSPDSAQDQSAGADGVKRKGECQTCKNRKYQDGSDDPGVSFKTAAHISPEMAASKVRGHEMEHVTRERSQARLEDKEVVSQSIVYHNAVCPECGRVYVSGGTTTTTTRGKATPESKFRTGLEDGSTGKYLDTVA